MRAGDVQARDPANRFLIDTILASGCSVLASDPKCGKTWTGLTMAVAVASGVPCFGRFDVRQPGPALLMLAEDGPAGAKERLVSICRSQDLDLNALPIDIITAARLRIDTERDQQRLARTIERLQPRFLLLDCWVRLVGNINSNDAGAVSQVLGYLRELQREYGTNICLVHHARKGSGGSGVSIRGSGDFWAWYDSGLHLRRRGAKVSLTIEHRAAPPPDPLTLALVGEDDDLHLALVEDDDGDLLQSGTPRDLAAEVSAFLSLAGAPVSGVKLREALRCKTSSLSAVLSRLGERGAIVREGTGWTLSCPKSPKGTGEGKGP